ncbi:MAG: hypothetical protein QOJ58_1815 [Alphaproteobacteria bacterium]|jgi:hypothetical protein|nr:hypothetical protein [Alphaproteobacteria bacterium]
MPIVLAGRRSATAALAQMCVYDLNLGIDLRGSRQIPAAAAGQSCAPTSSTNAFNGIDCHHPVRLPRPNPHSARGTTACHFPRFPSLEAFGRRPQASVVAAPSVTGRHPKPFTGVSISCCLCCVCLAPDSERTADVVAGLFRAKTGREALPSRRTTRLRRVKPASPG